MPSRCSYMSCRRTELCNGKVKMFRFPTKDKKRLQLWLKNAGNASLCHLETQQLRNRYICQNHFDTKSFVPDYGGRVLLNSNAVPHMYTSSPKGNDSLCDPHMYNTSPQYTVDEDIFPLFQPILKTYSKSRTSGIKDAGLAEPLTSTSEVPVNYTNLTDSEIFYGYEEIIGKKEIMEPIILVHGGAGDIPQSKVAAKIKGVKLAASVGYRILKDGGSVVDAVEAAVMSMEDDDAFNAGYGSVLNLDGEVEMEASIQRGSDLNVGAVTLIKDFAHPISLAKAVLEHTPHSMLGGDGARQFAIEMAFKPVPAKSLITDNAKNALEEFLKTKTYGMSEIGHDYSKGERPGGVGTVGAVALDAYGRIAVATSTGGMTGKYVGRIGDTPQIGSGTYADDTVGGVSTTGHGESILRYCVAHAIIKLMENGKTAQEATECAVKGMTNKLQNTAGAITLSNKGDVGIYFSTKRMAWAYLKENKIHYGIENDEFHSEAWYEES